MRFLAVLVLAGTALAADPGPPVGEHIPDNPCYNLPLSFVQWEVRNIKATGFTVHGKYMGQTPSVYSPKYKDRGFPFATTNTKDRFDSFVFAQSRFYQPPLTPHEMGKLATLEAWAAKVNAQPEAATLKAKYTSWFLTLDGLRRKHFLWWHHRALNRAIMVLKPMRDGDPREEIWTLKEVQMKVDFSANKAPGTNILGVTPQVETFYDMDKLPDMRNRPFHFVNVLAKTEDGGHLRLNWYYHVDKLFSVGEMSAASFGDVGCVSLLGTMDFYNLPGYNREEALRGYGQWSGYMRDIDNGVWMNGMRVPPAPPHVPATCFVCTAKTVGDPNFNPESCYAGDPPCPACPECPPVATPRVTPRPTPAPTPKPKGNNGVGNGEDGAPPGNPKENDGPGTSPGNPGNK